MTKGRFVFKEKEIDLGGFDFNTPSLDDLLSGYKKSRSTKLVKFLKKQGNCADLSFHSINTCQTLLSKSGMDVFAKFLGEDKHLKHLSITDTRLGTDGSMPKLAKAIGRHKCLKSLTLSSNYISDDSLKILVRSIKKSKSLKSLDLSQNLFTNTKYLIELCDDNKSIKELNLSHNDRVKSSEMKKFAKYLAKDAQLKEIDLTNMSLHKDVIKKIGIALQANKTLQELHLDYNDIQKPSFQYLQDALEENDSIAHVSLAEYMTSE